MDQTPKVKKILREVEALGSTEKAKIIKVPKEQKTSTKKKKIFYQRRECSLNITRGLWLKIL